MGCSRGSVLTHEETDETPVLYNSKDKYFLLKERQSQNGWLAREITPHVGRGGRDIRGEDVHSWMAWGGRTDDADVWTTERWVRLKRRTRLFLQKMTWDDR
jgi:hypothetical protein